MRHSLIRSEGVALLATVMSVSLVSGPALRPAPTTASTCVLAPRAWGFSGTHNPGVMHHGISGWDPTHVC